MSNSSKIHSLFSKIYFKSSVCILAIFIALVIVPILFILFTPIYIFRKILAISAKYIRPELRDILTTGSVLFSCDKLYETPACLILTSLTVEGYFPVEKLYQIFIKRVLVQTFPNGELKYPELKQYPEDWMGFKFWRPDDNFNISNHITCYKHPNDNPVTDSDLQKIRNDLILKPFKLKWSPWEILLVHNCIPSDRITTEKDKEKRYTVVLFRIHHMIADGYSFLQLIIEGLCGTPLPKIAQPKPVQKKVVQRISNGILFPFKCFYEFAETIILCKRKNPWYVSPDKRSASNHAITGLIPLKTIKGIKDHFNVSFTSVVLSACSGAMKEVLLRKKVKVSQNSHCLLPFPMPGRSLKLRNHMSQAGVSLPLTFETSPEIRLKMLDASFQSIKGSTSPIVNFFVGRVCGGLFNSLVRLITTSLVPPVLISNFPASFGSKLVIEGFEIIDAFFVCGLLDMPGLGFYILSYRDSLRIAVEADDKLLTADEVNDFARLIEKEFDLMEMA